MNLKHKLANWLMKGSSLSGSIGYVSQTLSAHWLKVNPQAFIDVGYRANPIAYRCISLVARSAARIPLVVYAGSPEKRGDKIENHWMLDLINNPNPMTDKAMLIEGVLSFEQITGNSYLEAVTVDSDRRIQELWILPSQNMSVKCGNQAMPTSYELQVNGKKVIFPIDDKGKSDIIHFRYFNPNNLFDGMSPMEPAFKSVQQHNKSGEFTKSLLDNQATPSGALVYSPKAGEDRLSDDQFKRLKTEMADTMQGTHNAGKPLLLDGGMSWMQMGLSPVSDLGLLDNKKMNSIEIALAYDVPPQFVGITEASTYNNVAEAKLDLYEQAVLPNLGGFCRVMTKFGKMFDDNEDWFLWYDEDAIEALEPRRAITFERAIKGIAGALLSVNEGRAMVGKPEITGGDDVFISSSLLPLSFEASVDEGE